MNNLIKVVQFYKIKNSNGFNAIESFFCDVDEKYYIKPTRAIKTCEFSFIFFAKTNKKNLSCPICFENIYTNNLLKIMPLWINKRLFFIQPSIKQYVKYHLVIIDFTHHEMSIDKNTILNFYDFLKQFPTLTICSNTNLEGIGGSINSHLHYQAGVMDMPIFHKDAELIEDDIYLVDWYLTTFLIKDNDIIKINEKYLYLLDKYQNEATSFNPVMFFRNDTIYLYLILRCGEEINNHLKYVDFKQGVGVFEAMGHFILNEQTTSPPLLIELAKKILSYKR
jgi:hypothetical protein